MNDQNMQTDDVKKLEEGDELNSLPSGDDLAISALSEVSTSKSKKLDDADAREVEESNHLAETLNSLQSLIERHANELTRIGNELGEKRESLKNVLDNDQKLSEAKAQLDVFSEQLKERKSQMQSDPQVVNLKVAIGELNQEKKELEETLSNHLVNYHSLTNSTSFDTSDGDQWEFKIKAKIKSKK